MINGFSEPFTEFQADCIRVSNNDVCTGCWNDAAFTFEAGDWNWCPRHRDDGRRFECSTEITPEIVIKAVDRVMAN
jgi:autotransporter strand-loop-strand O-heptosyltransferase